MPPKSTANHNQKKNFNEMLRRFANVIHRYQTANFSSILDLVRFFHELLGRPSIEVMIKIIESLSFVNFLSELTVKAVRKHLHAILDERFDVTFRKPDPEHRK